MNCNGVMTRWDGWPEDQLEARSIDCRAWMIPILEKCVDLRFVVLAPLPLRVRDLMSSVPECRFMMAHAGGQPFAKGDWNRAIMAAQRFENLYLETASSRIHTNFLETAVSISGPRK